ncbi:hypothetical protein C8J56DRAFT_903632 [Mycena floridula]|nr:hypothetical protein C8J56DRAFT_903632 [Mycena floridula]
MKSPRPMSAWTSRHVVRPLSQERMDVYLIILDGFQCLDDGDVDLFTPEWNASFTLRREDHRDDDAELPLIIDNELPQGDYQGGVNGGIGPSDIQDGPSVAAQFSDEDGPGPKDTYERE